MAKSAISEAYENAIVNEPQAQQLVENWKTFLDTKNAPELKDPYERYVMATLLANTEKTLKTEAVQTTQAFGSNYVPTMLGLVRQVFPRMIGMDLVSLQPMALPTGKMFFLDVQRDDGSDISDYTNWAANKDYAKHAPSGINGNPLGEAVDIAHGMRLSMASRDVNVAKSKKLYTEVSWELETDLRAYHNIDAAEILSGAAADEIAREWDAYIVAAVYGAAAANKTVYFGKPTTGYPVDKWPNRLQRAILQADNAVYKAKGRSTNYMVCGTEAALELMDLSTFVPNTAGFLDGGESAGFGLQSIGSISQTHRVYRSRYVPDNEIVLGRKGNSVLDSGLFLLSYVPLFITERVMNIKNQKYEQSFASRQDLFLGGRDNADGQKLFARVVLGDSRQGINETAPTP